jgi:hypothetical protein
MSQRRAHRYEQVDACKFGTTRGRLFRTRFIAECAEHLSDADAPFAAAPRAQLMRAFIEHKTDLGPDTARASDQVILDRGDDISALLLRGLVTALKEDDADWFIRHAWFVDLVTAMLEDAVGEPPDDALILA